MIGPEEMVALAGRAVPAAVRLRAVEQVLAGQAVAEAAAACGVSGASVRRWVRRWQESDSSLPAEQRLADLPRSGRPGVQATADQVVAAILAGAGARIDARAYSTRGIAEMTGLSQPIVSRAVSRLTPAVQPRAEGFRAWLRLEAFAVGFPLAVITASRLSHSARISTRGPLARSRRAAGVTAGMHAAGLAVWARRPAAESRFGPVTRALAVAAEVHADRVLIFDPLAVVADDDSHLTPVAWRNAAVERITELEEFSTRLRALLADCADVPGDLLDALAQQVTRGLEGLAWIAEARTAHRNSSESKRRDGGRSQGADLPAPNVSAWLPREQPSLTEQLALALREEIIDSGYTVGDRIRPAQLASRLGIGRAAVDVPLRRMVDDELLDGSHGDVRIPVITSRDVLDVYASRQALGIVLLRSLISRPRRDLVAVRYALDRIPAVARFGLRTGLSVGDADLRFQQEFARAAGLAQTARTFEALILRLRMYISVLRVDYSPAARRIIYDNTRIFEALERGDADSAIDAWRGKLDNAVRHMAGMVQHRSFDIDLWARLTG
ncbi:helix-turn-helix domain-containing protein [Brevibacterium sp. p3-SID960]|uniref:GntR family transcriptional regulator n=1 Tax=Brevibacterium sp. p3-SID960 TaxID=2916063 RepID=UPI0021A499FC|nr:helix-turn-helix domain-containing protein [Brevibacterium sp. p3-SID960]MCT1689503.1 helix-turn-helix domain-containing protein [Brevibacterium sp. p3-SID960]